MRSSLLKLTAAGALATAFTSLTGHAQSADAIIDKLVQKGILTEDEAKDLREDADQGFTTAYQVKSGMPDWVTALKINGDFRARAEGFYADTDSYDSERTRFRYRFRLAVVAELMNNFEVGLRLASGDGDPISTNQSLQDNASKKEINIDQAYAKWRPLATSTWSGALTVGKMENPFTFTDMTFDQDYTPEGLAWQMGYQINDTHALALNSGIFVLDELGANTAAPYYSGAQVVWDATWSKAWTSSLGVGVLGIANDDQLTNGNVPNIGVGNTRNANTTLANNINPIVVDAALTYTLESFPMYPTVFPIKLAGSYMNNPAATDNNVGYQVGIQFGKAGKKKTWDVIYTYKHLEADAIFEEWVDSDFGAYYMTALPNSGQGTGYRNGTNVKGHIVKLDYSPYDFLTLTGKWFGTRLINTVLPDQDSSINRVQIDAAFKF